MGIQNTSDLTAMINVDRNEIRIVAELSIGGRTVDKVFKIDTGAGFTCMNAADLGMEMDEITFSAMNTSGKIIARGVDNVTKLTYYKYQLDNFKIGTLDMGSVPIYITFNQFAAIRTVKSLFIQRRGSGLYRKFFFFHNQIVI
ncbi:MAG TPA: hypothetical protein DD414_12705 [Lachnospiraceae bacterium]|nr:hypothetical protein [Lachnospiraceae bacterium]